MSHSNALIEDIARTVPETVACWHLFQVFQNATLEVKDLIEAKELHIGGRLFAADTSGTKHGDAFGSSGSRAAIKA